MSRTKMGYGLKTTSSTKRVALIPQWLLDGTGSQPLEEATVIIKGSRIEDIIWPASKIGDVRDFPCLRFPNCTLLPGLIDSHVHLTFNPELQDLIRYHLETSDELLMLQGAENARKALMSGVTTVCDLGARNDVGFALSEAIERGVVEGSHVVVAGRPLTCPRGHLYFMGGEVIGFQQIDRLINGQIDQGAKVIKTIATGGGLTPGSGLMRAHFSREELELIVRVSHQRNTPVAAHAGWGQVIQQCAELGFDRLEHCTFITPQGLSIDEKILTTIKSHDPYVVPTRHQFVLKKNQSSGSLQKEVNRSFKELYEDSMAQMRRFREKGLRIAAGSDAGITDVPFDGVIGELETMVTAGYSPIEAVCAGTHNSAEALNLSEDRGIIRRGFRADLLVVKGAVHDDIATLRNTSVVLKNGRVVVDAGLAARCAR